MGTERIDDEPLLPDPSRAVLSWLRAFWLAILFGYAVVFVAGLEHVGLEDHDQFLTFHEIQCWNQELFGLDRQWTPVMGGGLSAAGNPQIPVLSPYMLAGYVLGPFWGPRLVAILYFVLGFAGAYLYAGLWIRRRDARALAAALFVGNGFFVCRLAYGHVTFLAFLALPALLWALHRAGPWAGATSGGSRSARRVLAVLLLGAALALLVDGNPHTIMYMMVWIGVYAVALTAVRRSVGPLLLFVGAVCVASLLDAAYVWSLVDSQWIHPRLRTDQFTNPLALLVFMVLPFRGNFPLAPTPDNGYELSVYIGVVVFWALRRHGRFLLGRLPRELGFPLLVTVVASIVLGVGSLKPLGVPTAFSPFDWLRELPGFRSLGVTGRYWGFLALPLSLLGAAALWRLITAERRPHRVAAWMIAALALQLVFQVGTIWPKLRGSRVYEPVSTAGLFTGDGERITYVLRDDDDRYTGEYLTPVTGVIDCYDLSEFLRPSMHEGDRLVRQAHVEGHPEDLAGSFDAWFHTWSRIRVVSLRELATSPTGPSDPEIRIMLNQAWHPYWRAGAGRIERHPGGNLGIVAPQSDLEAMPGGILLEFHDAVSRRGTTVSLVAWLVALVSILGLLWPALRRGPRAVTGQGAPSRRS